MKRYIGKPATRRGIVLLAVLAVLSVIATRDVRQDLQTTLTDVDTRLNYALFDFRAHLLDEEGKLAVTMEAPELRNNANSGVGSISTPEIYVRENSNDWSIRADTAVVSADRKFISMTGEVTVVRYNDQDSNALNIQTRDLVLARESRTVSTEARVNIQHAMDQIVATGMFLDLYTDEFELHKDVTAVYETL